MNLKKQILLTFDYELFLGPQSGTPQNCILTPTYKLLEVLRETKSKAIFFIDILYLYRLRELENQHPQTKVDYNNIIKQIQEIAGQGHYVYLHVHPHWLDAIYIPELNQWSLSNINRFAISYFNKNEAFELLKLAYNLLHEIISPVKGAHKIEGFRAGGLFIQPFDLFYDFLKQFEIPFEFSVYPYFKSKSNHCEVDFTHIPHHRIYKFESNCCIEQKNGFFTEYTISEISFAGLNRIINSGHFRINTKIFKDKPWGDGKGALHVIINNNKKIGIAGTVRESAAVELMNLWKNKVYLSYLKHNQLLHFLSHPKLISPLNLLALQKFLITANKKYEVITDFKHF